MSALYFHHYGRMFRIVATFPAADVAAANVYMLAHHDTGLIAIHEGLALIARLADTGVRFPTEGTAP